MRLLIKLFIVFLVLVFIILYFFGKGLIENLGARFVKTEIKIQKADFIPYKLAYKLSGIALRGKNISFISGEVSLIPLKLEMRGLKYAKDIFLNEDNFSLKISLRRSWKINILFKGFDIRKFGFNQGKAEGVIDGVYKKGVCELYGLLNLKDIVYTGGEDNFLGISPEEFGELIKEYKSGLELDFIYRGPIDKFSEVTRYRPGPKSMEIIKSLIFKKLTPKESS